MVLSLGVAQIAVITLVLMIFAFLAKMAWQQYSFIAFYEK